MHFLTSFISKTGAGPEKWSLVPYKSVLSGLSAGGQVHQVHQGSTSLKCWVEVQAEGWPCISLSSGRGAAGWAPTLVSQAVLLPRAQSNVTAAPRRLTTGTCFLRGQVRPSPLHLAWMASLNTESPRAETALCPTQRGAPTAVPWGALVASPSGDPPCLQGQTTTRLPGCPEHRRGRELPTSGLLGLSKWDVKGTRRTVMQLCCHTFQWEEGKRRRQRTCSVTNSWAPAQASPTQQVWGGPRNLHFERSS